MPLSKYIPCSTWRCRESAKYVVEGLYSKKGVCAEHAPSFADTNARLREPTAEDVAIMGRW